MTFMNITSSGGDWKKKMSKAKQKCRHFNLSTPAVRGGNAHIKSEMVVFPQKQSRACRALANVVDVKFALDMKEASNQDMTNCGQKKMGISSFQLRQQHDKRARHVPRHRCHARHGGDAFGSKDATHISPWTRHPLTSL